MTIVRPFYAGGGGAATKGRRSLGTVYCEYCEPVVLRSCLSAYSYTATTPDTYITNMNAKPNGGAFPKTACLAQSLRSQHNISLCTNTTNSIHYGNRCKS